MFVVSSYGLGFFSNVNSKNSIARTVTIDIINTIVDRSTGKGCTPFKTRAGLKKATEFHSRSFRFAAFSPRLLHERKKDGYVRSKNFSVRNFVRPFRLGAFNCRATGSLNERTYRFIDTIFRRQ